MRKFVSIFLLLLALPVVSQNQANWWFFGSNAGIDFNTGVPVTNNIGQLNTIEGCSAISDACGGLLFYTDGISVWDRNHLVMPNGNGLFGNPSSTQSAIVIPLPNNPDLYYVFSISIGTTTGLYYSVVDMNLNAGTGDVIVSQKNISLLANSTEKLFGAVAANGQDAWIVTYAESISGSLSFNQFYAFKLTPNGMDLSATVNSLSQATRTTDKRGYLKVSPDGTKVAMMTQFYVDTSIPDESGVGAWLFDFDNRTGVVNNPVRMNFPAGYQAYGTEFSLDSRLVYVDLNTLGNGLIAAERRLLQYDTTAPNFENNPVLIYQSDANNPNDDVTRGALQIAPDKKIYYARDEQEWLAVINNPNSIGALCNFQYNGLPLTPGTTSKEGLPPFYNAFFNPSFSVIEGCSTASTQLIADEIATCPNNSVLWDFGDIASGIDNSSTLINPTHVYTIAGTYTVSLVITTPTDVFNSSRIIQIVDTPFINTVSDLFLCDDSSNDGIAPLDFTATRMSALGIQNTNNFEVTIHSSLQDAENDFNSIADNDPVASGTYFIRIDNRMSNGCYITTSFDVTINSIPVASMVDDLILCDDFSNDNIESFDLDIAAVQGLGTQDPILVEYSFYASQNEANLRQNPISSPYDNTMANEEIFIRYENVTNTNCYEVVSFDLHVVAQPVIPIINDMAICDDESRDLVAVFDLNSLIASIENTQSGNLTTTFHSSLQDAELDDNPLNTNYSNTMIQEVLWVRLENNDIAICYDVQPLRLEVFPKPIVNTTADFSKCITEEGIIEATPGFATYLWDTGATTSSISITDEGTYTVIATDQNGCEDSSSTTVTNFQTTQIVTVVIEQFTLRSNRIEVSVIGDGPFEYSIDNFIFQESNVFTNLLPGYYTVYVRDFNGCDLVTAPATIIAAPPYFTPNEDGFHDYWQVTAIETEPDAQIYIFNRFGKLLKQISPVGPGWNGMYNGKPMPSTDYWYLVELIDGRSFKGHFSLKR
ncbi:T9SS type B sorting domain-containing protein [Nonlabens sp. Ci31]|uniref:T9SS type B sorting domain-containing protein n=1 Tax=Nonlabens sp. Ci31 TaxID=2608253 RepID=UPI0014630730|nr:T9SS type B sorting domain-containing protein [Nonlabens sp. Ci31]QJP35067.1 T9SS type B sorting domain-containing protein [Nonlabens sp. Ci31]